MKTESEFLPDIQSSSKLCESGHSEYFCLT